MLTMKSIKKVVKTDKGNEKILLTKANVETVIEITPTLLLGSKMINIVKTKVKTK